MKPIFISVSHRPRRAFTLVEMLVSTALVAVIMLLLLSTVDSTQKVWQRAAAKATQFQSARNGFEAMSRRLSQATLNTYWTAYDPDRGNVKAEFRYRRRSELQFITGPASRIFTSPDIAGLNPEPELSYPTHSVFFQAPIGYTESGLDTSTGVRQFASADSLLASCGYFIEFGDDPTRPDFLADINYPPKHRFRLMELSVPSERLTIFHRGDDDSPDDLDQIILDDKGDDYVGLVETNRTSNASFLRPFWMKEALQRETAEKGVSHFKFARVLAENVVAMIILPKLPQQDRVAPDRLDELAPSFEYDSWRVLMKGNPKKDGGSNEPYRNSARENLLPPIVQVIMVAIDETSALRRDATPEDPPAWTEGLFETAKTEEQLQEEIATLEKRLREDPAKLSYRVFSSDVVIRGSKWSARD